MEHLDLFSGIGGFAYAADQVFGDVEHTFCDNELFSQKIIAKHWPGSKIYGDIRDVKKPPKVDIITGGFPCQPFSSVGKRRGTEDDRYLWPEMLRVIRLAKPTWIIAENVRGLVTWNNGLVLEEACNDLENLGYSVQPFIIPACALETIHRRDRLWIVAHDASVGRQKGSVHAGTNTQRGQEAQRTWANFWIQRFGVHTFQFRQEDEPFICGVDDGLPDRVDRLKALGNAIVPQVAAGIMKAMATATNRNEKG